MNPKNALYAAVGAPISAAKALNARLDTIREELENRSGDLTRRAQERFEEWADEGRKAVEKVSEGQVVDELTSKVDFDQARHQVGKLRDQLEEMLNTWRASFRPEGTANGTQEPEAEKTPETKAEAEDAPEAKSPTKKASASRAPARKPASGKPASKAASKPTGSKASTSAAKSKSQSTKTPTKAAKSAEKSGSSAEKETA